MLTDNINQAIDQAQKQKTPAGLPPTTQSQPAPTTTTGPPGPLSDIINDLADKTAGLDPGTAQTCHLGQAWDNVIRDKVGHIESPATMAAIATLIFLAIVLIKKFDKIKSMAGVRKNDLGDNRKNMFYQGIR